VERLQPPLAVAHRVFLCVRWAALAVDGNHFRFVQLNSMRPTSHGEC
jgi:hypothetical protein